MKKVESPVSEALILICEKCGKKLSSSEDTNPARQIQTELKGHFKTNQQHLQYRAVVTSCFNICPDQELAIAIARTNEKNEKSPEMQFFTLAADEIQSAKPILDLLKTDRSASL